MMPGELERLHAQEALEDLLHRLLSQSSFSQVQRLARQILGADSFGLGVCYGLVSYPAQEVVNLLELGQVFLLADLHDQICAPLSALSFVGPTAGTALFMRGLFAFGEAMWLQRRLAQAHQKRELMFRELEGIMKNPAEFFVGLPAKLHDSYQAKWQRFLLLHRGRDLRSQFEAGKIFGELLIELLMTLASLVALGATVVKLGAKAPQLLKAAQRLRPGKADGRVAGASEVAAPSKSAAAQSPPLKAPTVRETAREVPPKVASIPADIVRDPRGVYGYMPTDKCSVKDMLDFSDPAQVAKARELRTRYLKDLEVKRLEIDEYIAAERKNGSSNDEIGRSLVDKRNADRMATYEDNPEGLAKMKARNAEKYDGREMGPDYDYLIKKGKTPEEILYGTTKSNRSMDILIGLEKPGG